MTHKQYVATPYGVRIDHYSGPGGELLYSEYIPGSRVALSEDSKSHAAWSATAIVALVIQVAVIVVAFGLAPAARAVATAA